MRKRMRMGYAKASLGSGSSCFILLLCLLSTGSCSSGGGETGVRNPNPSAVQITTGSLPAASVNVGYSTTLAATGGAPPYSWSLVSGTLPPGLALNAAQGEISGTPTQSGSFSFALRVQDSAGTSNQKSLRLDVSSSPSPQATITLDPNTTFQTWRAWRFTARGTKLGSASSACAAIPDAVLNAYQDDLVTDLGFTGIRLEQHQSQGLEALANDNSNPLSLNLAAYIPGLEAPLPNDPCGNLPKADLITKVILPVRNMVRSRNEPFELYVSFVYFTFSTQPPWWQSNVEEATEAVQAYWTWFQQNFGFYPDWFTYNEPASAGYFGNNRWMGNFTVALGNRFNTMGVASRIEQPSNPTASKAVTSYDNLIGVSGAAAFVGRVTFHGYDYNSTSWPSSSVISARNNLRSRAQSLGATTGMTEICCKAGWDGNYANGLGLVRDMYLNMTEANISVWEPLGVFSVCSSPGCVVGSGSGQNLINLEPDLSAYYLNPHYWVARQFMRYIRPGSVRIGVSCSGCADTPDRGPRLKAVAWRSTTNLVVVNLINESGGPLTVTVSGLPPATYDLFQLDPTLCFSSGGKNRCVPQAGTQTSPGLLTLTLPADAVWTLHQR